MLEAQVFLQTLGLYGNLLPTGPTASKRMMLTIVDRSTSMNWKLESFKKTLLSSKFIWFSLQLWSQRTTNSRKKWLTCSSIDMMKQGVTSFTSIVSCSVSLFSNLSKISLMPPMVIRFELDQNYLMECWIFCSRMDWLLSDSKIS